MPDVDKLIAQLFTRGVITLEDGPAEVATQLNQAEEAFLVDYDLLVRPDPEIWTDDIGFLLDQIMPVLGDGPSAVSERVKERVASRGGYEPFCAWYQPIHFFGYDWGIFIREDCLLDLAVTIACFTDRQVGTFSSWQLALHFIRAAFFAYYLHEHLHHKVECFGIRLLIVEDKNRYTPYKRRVYRPTYLTPDNLEEALANADSYERLKNRPYSTSNVLHPPVRAGLRDALRWIFNHSPPGYSDAPAYLGGALRPGLFRLQAQIQEASLNPTRHSGGWEFAPNVLQSFLNIQSNIWSIVRPGAPHVLPRAAVAPVRTPSSRDVERLLIREGFNLEKGGKGSHKKFKKKGAPIVIVPANRQELSPGVAKNIARALDLPGIPGLLKAV